MRSREKRTRSLGVIVYLTQARHATYGRNSLELLQKSVTLLTRNYNAQHRDDIIFFYTGDINTTAQESVLTSCGVDVHARFVQIDLSVPHDAPPAKLWAKKYFSGGYRSMIRLYTVGLWKLVAHEGYEYVMRVDEDSFFWSPIPYNMFHYMAKHSMEYGYRLGAWEPGESHNNQELARWRARKQLPRVKGDIHAFVHSYLLTRQQLSPSFRGPDGAIGWLFDANCPEATNVSQFTDSFCGPKLYVPYNNFLITKVSFWLTPEVQHYLQYVDRSHVIYTHRWADHLLQSIAIALYMPREKVHMFSDWAYEHSSFISYWGSPSLAASTPINSSSGSTTKAFNGLKKHTPCLFYGGIVLGSRGDQSAAQRRLHELATKTPVCRNKWARQSRLRPCVGVYHDAANSTHHLRHYLINGIDVAPPFCGGAAEPYFCTAPRSDMKALAASQPGGVSAVKMRLLRKEYYLAGNGTCCCGIFGDTSTFVPEVERVLGGKFASM